MKDQVRSGGTAASGACGFRVDGQALLDAIERALAGNRRPL